jgi:hypothetical protein
MATPQLSPGVLIREVDLTVGRAENVLDNIGAIAGPFSIGPVAEAINISNERELLEVFGKPLVSNSDYWMSASSYLSYGGVLKVVRSDNNSLNNSNVAVGNTFTNIKINNFDAYNLIDDAESLNAYYIAKNPGTWADGLKVCYIDDVADQILELAITNPAGIGLTVGLGVTTQLENVIIPGDGVLETFNGHLKGIITEIEENLTSTNISVKILSRVSSDGVEIPVSYNSNNEFASIQKDKLLFFNDSSGDLIGLSLVEGFIQQLEFQSTSSILSEASQSYPQPGQPEIFAQNISGNGTNATFSVQRDSDGDISSVILQNGGSGYSSEDQLLISGTLIGGGGSILNLNYEGTTVGSNAVYEGVTGTTSGNGVGASFRIERDETGAIIDVSVVNSGIRYEVDDIIIISGSSIGGVDEVDDLTITVSSTIDNDEIVVTITGVSEPSTFIVGSANDWYDQQTLNLENSVIFWRSIAEKPVTSVYSLERSGFNDGLHVVVVDDRGSISGINGNILEKHLNLSKARDAVSAVDSPTRIWYKDYLANFSKYIFAGKSPSQGTDSFHNTTPKATGFVSGFIPFTTPSGVWGQDASNITFSSIGNKTYDLSGGSDYGSGVTLSDLVQSYELFSNKDEIDVNYLIYGPSMPEVDILKPVNSQAKANKLISIATLRKDCIAVISPYKEGVVDITNTETQTNNIIKFFSPLTSSSYAVFDSGYKYTFDRFNNQFRYIPCNADIAGLMARTTLNSFPWFSPAGQQRGVLNNAVKLAYNPNKDQRDRLYTARVNSIVNQPGSGILLFGDKTALGFASAFDRINVRRLFITVQRALQSAADAQLFEFNDELTRSNFVNIVEPFLRDVQAKRGVFDFRVICDESNNTPDVIDNNEFRADIFLKPARSINYVTLTFIATRTGVSFEEVAGNV